MNLRADDLAAAVEAYLPGVLRGVSGSLAADATVTVAEVDLMQSTLQKDGPVYQVRYHERLS